MERVSVFGLVGDPARRSEMRRQAIQALTDAVIVSRGACLGDCAGVLQCLEEAKRQIECLIAEIEGEAA